MLTYLQHELLVTDQFYATRLNLRRSSDDAR